MTRRELLAGSAVILTALALAAVLASASACGGNDNNNSGSAATPAASAGVSGALTVLAAASLTETFTQIGKDFEAAHSGSHVKFNFAGSSALAQQINQGAPADVFASTANYMDHYGWMQGVPWGAEVKLPMGFAYGQAELDIEQPVQHWRQMGVRRIDGTPLPAPAHGQWRSCAAATATASSCCPSAGSSSALSDGSAAIAASRATSSATSRCSPPTLSK